MAKGPFMEFLRALVVQTAINTYQEIQMPTPTSKTENMAMLIHSIELYPTNILAGSIANGDVLHAHLSKTTKTAPGKVADADILAEYRAYAALAEIFHDTVYMGSQKHTFDPPILYPHANLYAAIQTTGFTSVVSLNVRVGYTLEKVSREDFISALVE
ncbi:hypothetical protein ES705_48902 [subsurface metagenome]